MKRHKQDLRRRAEQVAKAVVTGEPPRVIIIEACEISYSRGYKDAISELRKALHGYCCVDENNAQIVNDFLKPFR